MIHPLSFLRSLMWRQYNQCGDDMYYAEYGEYVFVMEVLEYDVILDIGTNTDRGQVTFTIVLQGNVLPLVIKAVKDAYCTAER